MNSTGSSSTFARHACALASLLLASCAAAPPADAPLFNDDFTSGLGQWHIEAEKPAAISAANGVLDIDAPAGVTLWFKPRLSGPVAIEFDATAVAAGGPNDAVSDLNVFWMANNRDDAQPRPQFLFQLLAGQVHFPAQQHGVFEQSPADALLQRRDNFVGEEAMLRRRALPWIRRLLNLRHQSLPAAHAAICGHISR